MVKDEYEPLDHVLLDKDITYHLNHYYRLLDKDITYHLNHYYRLFALGDTEELFSQEGPKKMLCNTFSPNYESGNEMSSTAIGYGFPKTMSTEQYNQFIKKMENRDQKEDILDEGQWFELQEV